MTIPAQYERRGDYRRAGYFDEPLPCSPMLRVEQYHTARLYQLGPSLVSRFQESRTGYTDYLLTNPLKHGHGTVIEDAIQRQYAPAVYRLNRQHFSSQDMAIGAQSRPWRHGDPTVFPDTLP